MSNKCIKVRAHCALDWQIATRFASALCMAFGEGTYRMKDMAGSIRRQLNRDLLLAMKAKDTVAISALRSVLSALDNASAVPISTVAAPVFGHSGDVPRKKLSETDCQKIISAEVSARSDAAEEYTRLGRGDEAARLRAEQVVVERYARTSEHVQQSVAAYSPKSGSG